jgi:hypothetical protein
MVLELKILNSKGDLNFCYLPHGVSTLKVGVNNSDKNTSYRLVVRPTNRSEPPDYVAYESSKNGKKSGTKDVKIIWGGGMTEGFELTLPPGHETTLFYLIIHDSINLDSYSFDIEAVEVTKDELEKRTVIARTVNIIPPKDNDPNDIVKMKVNFEGVNSRLVEFEGKRIPEYKSRWFSHNDGNDYSFRSSDYPQFVLKYAERGQFVSGEMITVGIKSSMNIKPIATISGDMERSKLHAEIFHFVDHYYVLRIWCYWINDFFEGNRVIVERVHGEGTRRNTELRAWKQNVIEVPDAERFDLVFDKKNEKVVFVGTDLHWRETWWSVNGDIALLRFANLELVPVLIKNLPQLKTGEGNDYDPASRLKEILAKKQEPRGDLNLMITEETDREDASKDTILGHGLHRKHVPYVLNSPLMPAFRSGKVTKI